MSGVGLFEGSLFGGLRIGEFGFVGRKEVRKKRTKEGRKGGRKRLREVG